MSGAPIVGKAAGAGRPVLRPAPRRADEVETLFEFDGPKPLS